jgi:hypothetical protein
VKSLLLMVGLLRRAADPAVGGARQEPAARVRRMVLLLLDFNALYIAYLTRPTQVRSFGFPKEDASRENDHAPSARSASVGVLGGVPTREIARRIGVAPSTVRTTIKRFQAGGLSWPLPAARLLMASR